MNKIEIEERGCPTIRITTPFWQAEPLRDGRTLLPTTPEEIAKKLNSKPKRGIVEKLMAVVRALWIAYLKRDLRGVELAVDDIPRQMQKLLEYNDWRHQHRAIEITGEAARRKQEGLSRIEELKSHLRGMGVEA